MRIEKNSGQHNQPDKEEKRQCQNCGFHFTYLQLNAKRLCHKCELDSDWDRLTRIALEKSKKEKRAKTELTEADKVALIARRLILKLALEARNAGNIPLEQTILKRLKESELEPYVARALTKQQALS